MSIYVFQASTPRIARQQTVIVRAQAEQSTRRAALMAGVAALIGLGAAEAEAKMINKSSSCKFPSPTICPSPAPLP